MVGLVGCWQNVSGLNAVCIVVGAITGNVRACACRCVRVCYLYIYKATDGQTDRQRPNHPNVKQNIIELMKVKVLARVKYSAYLCK